MTGLEHEGGPPTWGGDASSKEKSVNVTLRRSMSRRSDCSLLSPVTRSQMSGSQVRSSAPACSPPVSASFTGSQIQTRLHEGFFQRLSKKMLGEFSRVPLAVRNVRTAPPTDGTYNALRTLHKAASNEPQFDAVVRPSERQPHLFGFAEADTDVEP
jgi:hypothetical protein